MLRVISEIFVAFLGVYGGYCLVLNFIYTIFCKEKSKIYIAFFADEKNNDFSDIFFAKKAFLGRSRGIIVVECKENDENLCRIVEKASGTAVFRAERMDGKNGDL